jgi:hypothetical protein
MHSNRRSIVNRNTLISGILLGLGVLLLVGSAQAAPLACPLGVTPHEVLGTLFSIALATAARHLASCIFDYPCMAQTVLNSLISLWSILLVIAAAVLLRNRFADKVGQ